MIYQKNIAKLKEIDSELADAITGRNSENGLEVVQAKNGMPSLRIQKTCIHSLYDPVKEAEAWARHYADEINQAESLCVFGFGLGYHLLELCECTDKEITVFEPRSDILKKAFETIDLTSILSRIRIVIDGNILPGKCSFEVLHHKPSVNLNPEYFNEIKKRLKSRETIAKGLSILVIGPIYGGSLEVARYCSSSLIKMGHRVELIDSSSFKDALFMAKDVASKGQRHNRMLDLLSSFISEMIMARCESFKPDLVLVLAQAPVTSDCINQLRQKGVTTAYWFVEDFRFMEYWKKIAGNYDFFFTIQRDAFFTELENAGIKNYHYLPMAACPDVHKPVQLSDEEKNHYGSPVSFVGAGYYNRRHFFQGLLDYDLKIWGTDWDMQSPLAGSIQRSGERIDTDEIVKIFNGTDININLHSSTYHKGVNPFGDFVNPRTFEIIACGGFQLVDRRAGLDGLFKMDEEIVLFDDLSDLRDKVSFYLSHPEEREMITEKGRERVLREHTYENRMQEMLEVIAGQGLKGPQWKKEGEDIRSLLEEAGETELGTYLSRFSERDSISLSDIADEISKGEGDITDTEALLLMMNEFTR
jgi:spore maturation protein CgeB